MSRVHLVVCFLACALASVAPARAADVPQAVGYELGAWRWNDADDSFKRGTQAVNLVSVGRWQRLTRAVTWDARLAYADLLPPAAPAVSIPEDDSWSDIGRSVMVETGLALHPPVRIGLAPYMGASLGLGYARPGDSYDAYLGTITRVRRRHAGAGAAFGLELGLRVFSRPGWPTLRATLGGRWVSATEGPGWSPEPLAWLGYSMSALPPRAPAASRRPSLARPPSLPLHRTVGYEVGAWRWKHSPDALFMSWQDDGPILLASAGRWQRLRPCVTWLTRVEYADLVPQDDKYRSWNVQSRYERGTSLTANTGLALHPPVRVGLAPFVAASVGAGYARAGVEHITTRTFDQELFTTVTTETTKRHGGGVGLVAGVEAGLRVFSPPGWPTLCVALGSRTVTGQRIALTTAPVVAIGW